MQAVKQLIHKGSYSISSIQERQTLAQTEACSFPTDTTFFLRVSTFLNTCQTLAESSFGKKKIQNLVGKKKKVSPKEYILLIKSNL